MNHPHPAGPEAAVEQAKQLSRIYLPALILIVLATGWWQDSTYSASLARSETLADKLWSEQPARYPLEGLDQNWVTIARHSPLAVFEPGMGAWLAPAIYLQLSRPARAQDQPAYDNFPLGRQEQLSPALVLQIFYPVLAVMIVWRQQEPKGWSRPLIELLERSAPALGLAILGAAVTGLANPLRNFDLDAAYRLILLLAVYVLYAAAVMGGTLLLFRLGGKRMGLALASCFWLFQVTLARPITVNIASSMQPLPTLEEFVRVLDQETRMGYLGADPREDRQRRYVAEALAEFKVASVAELPVNISALILQREERHAREIFRRRVGELRAKFERQESIERGLSLLFPAVAIQLVSASLARTDHASERWQIADAESRWDVVTGLVFEAVVKEAKPDGSMPGAGPDFWAKLPSFRPDAPPVAYNLRWSLLPLGALLLWALGIWPLGIIAARQREEAA